jgi:hypothetical protein
MSCRPRRVYLDEGCEHFVNGYSVTCGGLGDLPQCENAAEPDGGLVVAELFDRASKSLRQLPLPRYAELVPELRALLSECAALTVEVQQRDDHRG